MVTVGKYKDNYDTATKTANKSMGFDPSAIQSCVICCDLSTLHMDLLVTFQGYSFQCF